MLKLKANPECTHEVIFVGREKTPVLLIDDPVDSTADLVDYAATRARFSSDGAQAYPGIRAPLPDAYAQVLEPLLRPLIGEVYGLPDSLGHRYVHQLFSLVSQSPDRLDLLQRLPHFDNHSPFYFATVHYLNPPPHGGTGIFRHRPTGFESVSAQRYPLFVSAAKAHVERAGPPPARYIDRSDDHFELIRELAYRQNRLVLYPGYLLHSGLIDPAADISADPRKGRLTANLFLLFDA